jgi:aspartate/methionine/tyrosine aminotransferase
MDVVERLVRDYRVAIIPGATFGLTDGCYLRISYGALDEQCVIEAIDRLVRGLKTLCEEHP